MWHRIMSCCAVAGALLFTHPALACDEQIRVVLELSGVKPALALISEGIKAGVNREQAKDRKLTKKQAAELAETLHRALDPGLVERDLQAVMRRDCDPERLAAAAQSMRLPLFAKVIDQELAAAHPSAEKKMERYFKGLEKRPPSPERVDLLRRLDEATASAEIDTELRLVMIGLLVGGEPRDEAARAQLDQLRSQMLPRVREEFLAKGLYAYRTLTDRELADYVALWEQEAMGWTSRQTGYALRQAIAEGMQRVRSELIGMLGRMAATPPSGQH